MLKALRYFRALYRGKGSGIFFLFSGTPSAPYNLTSSLRRNENPPFAVKLSWNQPDENGGMPVLEYSLEYKVPGLPWEDGEMRETNDRHMLVYKYEESYKYEVRVRARNIFGFGPQSKVKVVYFAGIVLICKPSKIAHSKKMIDLFKKNLKMTVRTLNRVCSRGGSIDS